jgi:CXCXC repeat protein
MSEQETPNTRRGEGSFDELAKGLAGGTVSRGKALRMLGAALFGGMLASIPGVALGAPPGRGRPSGSAGCPHAGQIRVDGQCVCPTGNALCPSTNKCVSNQCGTNQTFNPATCQCVCPSDTTLCLDSNECVPNNVCSDPYVLNPNSCSCECPEGTRPCGALCVSDQCAYNEIFNPDTCQCEALTSPSLLSCVCQDSTEMVTCTPVNCNSGPAQDEVCNPLCAEHGGLFATGCFFDDPSCMTG